MRSINPTTEEPGEDYPQHSSAQVRAKLDRAETAFLSWRATAMTERARLMHRAAALLRQQRDALAMLMTREMGKTLAEGEAEVEKCATGCEHFADHAAEYLQQAVAIPEKSEQARQRCPPPLSHSARQSSLTPTKIALGFCTSRNAADQRRQTSALESGYRSIG